MTTDWIKLSLPQITGTEMKWIEDAFAEGWVVPLGPNVDEFEHRLENYLGAGKSVVALSAGTAALHLGLAMLGVEAGDEVICQDLTFSASANPIKYLGGKPVFVDSETDTWNMDPDLLANAIEDRIKATGRKPKAIVAVDLYGMPAKLDEILAVADNYGIPVLEDAAEALGSTYKGRLCGTLGKYGGLSFNGNKIITTSGGGALVCPDKQTADRVKFLSTQARENRPYYYHTVVGYNYRLSNVSAGIGCGQMDSIDWRVERRRAIHALYTEGLADIEGIEVQANPTAEFNSNFWLSTILIDPSRGTDPDTVRRRLLEEKIETRLLWRPMHMQPVFADCDTYLNGTSQNLFDRGLCLPSGSSLTDTQIARVIDCLHKSL